MFPRKHSREYTNRYTNQRTPLSFTKARGSSASFTRMKTHETPTSKYNISSSNAKKFGSTSRT